MAYTNPLNNFGLVHKRGDTFDRTIIIPAVFPDGYFVGWVPYAQVKTARYSAFISNLVCSWEDPLTTRKLILRDFDTINWPEGNAVLDVQFVLPGVNGAEDYSLSTNTIDMTVVRDVTTPNN